MKTNYNLLNTIAITLVFTAASFGQATIAKWNFNGGLDAVPGGVTSPTPAFGAGVAGLVGGTTATFANGNSTPGTTETETTSPPNYGWNVSSFPAAGTGSKTAGAAFYVSTVGQAGITFSYEQRHSNTSANTYVVQYTTDASVGAPVWVDANTFTFTPAATGTGDTWYNSRSTDLSAISALNDNPNVGLRIVSAFDPGVGDYVASKLGSTYAGGTARLDQVTITSTTTLSTPDFTANSAFRIYPNPSNKEVVNFSAAQDVEVYDATGKVILKALNTTSIDTKSFSSGVYFIKTATGISRKLIVN